VGEQREKEFRKMKKATIALMLICTVAFAQQKGSFTDTRDKKTYKTVKIGKQTWMAENLNFNAESSVCYDNKPENCEKYGRLYNWDTAIKACPSGWHLPNLKDWQTLVDLAGGWGIYDSDDGELLGNRKLKAKSGWESDLNDGTDDYGFSALPGGRGGSDGNFKSVGEYGSWWTANERKHTMDFDGSMGMTCADFYYMSYFDVDAARDDSGKSILYSVRCVKN
jgi:uncharacterized protein (TIGR02145 family)